MNVTSVGTTPTPLPAPLPVSKPVAADKAADARHEAQQQAQQARQPEKVELPPLKPVSPQEFRVMLGALPVSALSGGKARNGSFDVYA